MFYSKSTGGFYDSQIHNDIPNDAMEISESIYKTLMDGQSSGKTIAPNKSGMPILIDSPSPSAENILLCVKSARLSAYRNEADPLFFKSQRGECSTEEWLNKIKEIKQRYPDGVFPVIGENPQEEGAGA